MKEGDIALANIPQANGRPKRRPVLLLKKLPGYGDFLVCGISSQIHQAIEGFDLILDEEHPDYPTSGLVKPSVIRLTYLAQIPSNRIPGIIGQISQETLHTLLKRLSAYLISSETDDQE